jgi:MFS family permease
MTSTATNAAPVRKRHFTVVAASATGTVFEWYDFFVFGSLTAIMAKLFFAGVNETAAYIFALLAFAAAFAARPIGALVFGRVGDLVGRKFAFLVTITLMGVATFAIGLLPTYATAGITAPILLIGLRLIQGFALGGEYGGAAIYVAEHSPHSKRGSYTGWIQTSASVGLLLALGIVFVTRNQVGEEAFLDWGWRVPYLVSLILLIVSVWIRLRLEESPVFKKMREEGTLSKAPYTESFFRWKSLKIVLLVLFGIVAAQGVIWYTYHFYVQTFLDKVLKVDPATINEILIIAVAASMPMYWFFAWLSDKIGRKVLMFTAIAASAIGFFPLFHALAEAANPALVAAQARSPVSVIAEASTCSLQFDPVGKAAFTTSCDIAKSVLAGSGISYSNVEAPKGAVASVRVGDATIQSIEGTNVPAAELKAARTAFETQLKAALAAAGYPDKADPARFDYQRVVAILLIFMVLATMLYGPQAAALVELFPSRIRYTALSLPYHIGTGWFGGFLPAAVFAIQAASGDVYYGLWYPTIVAGVSAVVCLLFLPETRKRDIHAIA